MLDITGPNSHNRSAERIHDFLLIDQEPMPSNEGKPPAYWPASGSLKAENLSARYSNGEHDQDDVIPLATDVKPSTDGPLVLQNISFDIKGGERVGIGSLF